MIDANEVTADMEPILLWSDGFWGYRSDFGDYEFERMSDDYQVIYPTDPTYLELVNN